jgi:glycine/D-amino acid oxidase-like deaminating enzyme/nitrite reductase/ring-hydroxylating ferredoxin subunit
MKNNAEAAPIWQPIDLSPPANLPPLVDVVIVGAGIAGLSVAWNLCRGGCQVLVLDDGRIGGGQTSCTTAHLASEIDDRYFEIERIHGKQGARLAAQAHRSAIDFIEQTAGAENIACEFTRVDGYLFVPPGESDDVLHCELQSARDAGLDVDMLPRAPWSSFDTGPALRFPRQGQFDPMRYLDGLARAILDRGGQIVTGCHVTRIRDGAPASVEIRDGRKVLADQVVVATNSPVNDRVAIHTKQAGYLTYVVGLPVPRGYVPVGLYWDTQDPYHYVRIAHPHTDPEMLLVGGEDHRTGQASDQEERFARLERWARERFPAAGSLAYRWSGQVMETIDGLAFIGRNPGDDNVYIVTGDSGMGMTHGTIAGILLGDLILHRDNPWAELFDPARKRIKAAGEFVRELAGSFWPYADYLTPGDVSHEDEIAPGSGAVVRHVLRKLAVYRDDQGQLHTCSAVCPHLGSIVTWNDAEKTWDCPAHGSRFTCTGEVIQGPANADLEPVPTEQPAAAR